jgi:sugar O-acyltransferase (sialic acid O-acetyltransferase NeuD family)
MHDLAIYGAGGLGRETSLMVQQINDHKRQWNVLGFFDDGKPAGSRVEDLPVLGGIGELNAITSSLAVAVAIANPQIRREVVSRIKTPHARFPVLIHPQAQTGSTANIFKRGTIITAGVIVTTGISFDEFVIINLATTIGHDVSIGAFTSVLPGCRIAGNVQVGEEVLLGTGATILQNLKIGTKSKVGAGSVVIEDVLPDTTVVGVPAKLVNR